MKCALLCKMMLLGALAIVGSLAHAGNVKLWSGGGDGSHWSDALNWVGGAPAANDSVSFVTNRVTICDVSTQIAEIIFSGGGNIINPAVGFSINLNTLASTFNIESSSAGGDTINAPIAIVGSATMFIRSSAPAGTKL